jgi:hypothetical protein
MDGGRFVQPFGLFGTTDLFGLGNGAGVGTNFEPPPQSARNGMLCNCGCAKCGGEAPMPPGNGTQGVEDCYLAC